MQLHFRESCKQDLIFWVTAGMGAAAFALAILSFFNNANPFLLVVSHLQPESVEEVSRFIKPLRAISFGAACSGWIYAFCWCYFSTRLPKRASPTGSSRFSVSFLELIFLVGLFVIAVAIRWRSINRGLEFDELFTVVKFVNVDSLGVTISSSTAFNNHIFYSILTYFSSNIFGQGEWALRLPALLLGLASLSFYWFFSRTLVEKKAALLATAGMTIAPSHVLWSVSARGYSGMILFTLISTFLFFKLLKAPTKLGWLLFVLASAIGIYTHLYASLVALTQITLLLVLAYQQLHAEWSGLSLSARAFRYIWSAFLAIVITSVLCYALVLPKLIYWVLSRGSGRFQPFFPIELVVSWSGDMGTVAVVVTFSLFVVGLVAFWKSHRVEALYVILAGVLPVLIIWFSRPYFLFPRFFVYFLPFYILLLALGWFEFWHYSLQHRKKLIKFGGAGGSVIYLLLILYSWSSYSWQNIPEAGWQTGFRDATNSILMDVNPSVGLCAIGADAELFQFYGEGKLTIPTSVEEIMQMAQNYSEIRCVYFKQPWESSLHSQIADFLFENAEWQHIKESFYTFRYQVNGDQAILDSIIGKDGK